MELLTPCPPFRAIYFCTLHILHAKENNLIPTGGWGENSIRGSPYFRGLCPFNIHENLIIYDFSHKEGRLWKYNI